jgi:hypothetical protein
MGLSVNTRLPNTKVVCYSDTRTDVDRERTGAHK